MRKLLIALTVLMYSLPSHADEHLHYLRIHIGEVAESLALLALTDSFCGDEKRANKMEALYEFYMQKVKKSDVLSTSEMLDIEKKVEKLISGAKRDLKAKVHRVECEGNQYAGWDGYLRVILILDAHLAWKLKNR